MIIQDDIPDGMGETTLTLEWRRIKQFTDPAANVKNLPAWKQEMNWMSILEGMHHKEAELLTYVKDGQLLKLYLSFYQQWSLNYLHLLLPLLHSLLMVNYMLRFLLV